MQIISWNIQKITATKAAGFASIIGGHINSIVGDEPFVLLILENKTKPAEVLNPIVSGILAASFTTKTIKMGGSSGVRENLLIVCGNGAILEAAESFDAWRTSFDANLRADHAQIVGQVADRVDQLNAARPVRPGSSLAAQRGSAVARASAAAPKTADMLRDPIAVRLKSPTGAVFKILALHAPGPSDGAEFSETYAMSYAKSVLETAGAFDMVVGDFNLRTSLSWWGGFFDRSFQTGATTKGSDGRHGWSRLDRVYIRPGVTITPSLYTDDGPAKDLTDHHCLVIDVDRRVQHRITDYFPHTASPLNRRFLSLTKKQEARKAAFKSGINAEAARERRIQKAHDDRRARRAADMSERRRKIMADM